MPQENRREFLRRTTAGLAGVAMLGPGPASGAGRGSPVRRPRPGRGDPAPPADAAAGHPRLRRAERRGRRVHPFPRQQHLALRAGHLPARAGGSTTRRGDEELHRFGPSSPRPTPIHPGSYVHVEEDLPAETSFPSPDGPVLGPALAARPRAGAGHAVRSGRQAGSPSWSIRRGRCEFYLGDGGPFRSEWLVVGPKLQARRWHHVVGIWDGGDAGALARRRARGRRDRARARRGRAKAPLRLGALGRAARPTASSTATWRCRRSTAGRWTPAEVLRLHQGRRARSARAGRIARALAAR